jgi:hypothetical protein
LSNFHSPEVIQDVLNHKRKGDGAREQAQTPVPCPKQNKDYSETFHLIDKGNGAESKYDIALESHRHGWTPKLSMRYFNMGTNNAYKVYEWLVDRYTTGRRYYDMGESIDEAAHAFLQRGAPMRKQAAEHPEYAKDISRMFDLKVGRKLRNDAKGYQCARSHGRQAKTKTIARLRALRSYQSRNSWQTHQSVPCAKRGKCAYKGCPNLRTSKSKRKRSYDTFMKCEEYSAEKGTDVYYCNGKKGKELVMCHLRYHMKHVPPEVPHEAYRIN